MTGPVVEAAGCAMPRVRFFVGTGVMRRNGTSGGPRIDEGGFAVRSWRRASEKTVAITGGAFG